MRNLKKFLALVLAMMMAFSLMVTVNAASTNFTDDAEINETYATAAEVLDGLDVFQGYPDGSFKPKGDITRAEVAAILYRIATGDVTTDAEIYKAYGTNKFTDVPDSHWAIGFINYVSQADLVKGYGNGKYGPDDNVTGYQVLAMMLRAIGYGKNGEYEGAAWAQKVNSQSLALNLTRNLRGLDLGGKATREMVAEIVFQALQVPQVVYTPLLDYYTPILNRQSLGEQMFNLKEITGELTAIDAAKGTATVTAYDDNTALEFAQDAKGNNVTCTVTGLNIDVEAFQTIGYSVCVWGQAEGNQTDATKYKALTNVAKVGTSLYVTTGGEDEAANGIEAVAADNGVNLPDIDGADDSPRVYFNGKLLPVGSEAAAVTLNGAAASVGGGEYYYRTNGKVYFRNTNSAKYGYPVDLNNGVKVDYIDNDNGGDAEVVVITEYTVADVSGIATDKNIGADAIDRNTINFKAYNINGTVTGTQKDQHTSDGPTTKTYKTGNVVCDDELAVKDLITYVDYKGVAYAILSEPTVEKFTQINYDKARNPVSYVLGGEARELASEKTGTGSNYAQQYFRGTDNLLASGKLNSTYEIFLDPYGYVLKVQEPTTTLQYLYVHETNHSDKLDKLTEARVIFDDGSVLNKVTLSYGNVDKFGELIPHIYSYTEDDDGYYAISTPQKCTDVTMDLAKNTMTLGSSSAKVTRSTVFVDARNVTNKTTEVDTYIGYQNLPTIIDAEIHYVTDGEDYVTLAYIVDGDDYADVSAEFIVYQTDGAKAVKEGSRTWWYLDVLSDGDYATVKLTEDQWDCVDTYGVGVYAFDNNEMAYMAFNEAWEQITWKDGHLTIGSTSYGYDPDTLVFFTLNITKGEAYDYAALYGTDGVDDFDAYAIVARSGRTASEIYVVSGKLAYSDSTNPTTQATQIEPGVEYGDVVGHYWQRDSYITEFVEADDEGETTVTITLTGTGGLQLGEITALQSATGDIIIPISGLPKGMVVSGLTSVTGDTSSTMGWAVNTEIYILGDSIVISIADGSADITADTTITIELTVETPEESDDTDVDSREDYAEELGDAGVTVEVDEDDPYKITVKIDGDTLDDYLTGMTSDDSESVLTHDIEGVTYAYIGLQFAAPDGATHVTVDDEDVYVGGGSGNHFYTGVGILRQYFAFAKDNNGTWEYYKMKALGDGTSLTVKLVWSKGGTLTGTPDGEGYVEDGSLSGETVIKTETYTITFDYTPPTAP